MDVGQVKGGGKDTNTCRICGGKGHWANVCPSRDKGKGKGKEERDGKGKGKEKGKAPKGKDGKGKGKGGGGFQGK